MRPEAARLAVRAILTRAAEAEGRRQSAKSRGDVQAERDAEAELRKLWAAHSELDRQCA